MGRFLFVAFVITAIVVLLTIVGGSLPEGNPLRDATEGLRAIGGSIADGFGGGYQPATAG